MINQIDPVERGKFDGFEMPPGPEPTNYFGLKEADDRFRERVVVRIPATAHGQRDGGIGETIGVAHREVLGAAITVMHEAVRRVAAPLVDGLLERVEHKVGRQGGGDAPPDDTASETAISNAT